MKKILLLAVVLFASLNASAQWYIGGSVGFGSVKPSGGDSEAVFSILPELGYQLNDKWSVGAKVGYHKGDGIAAVINSTNTRVDLTEEFIIRPYARVPPVSFLTRLSPGSSSSGRISRGSTPRRSISS